MGNSGPGRPKRIVRAPSHQRLQRVAERRAANASHADSDPVVRACFSGDSYELLHQARVAAAEEAASLRWRLQFDPPTDSEVPKLRGRRITALNTIAQMTLAMHWSHPAEPSPALMERVKELFLQSVEEAVREVIESDSADRLIGLFRARIGEDRTRPG